MEFYELEQLNAEAQRDQDLKKMPLGNSPVIRWNGCAPESLYLDMRPCFI